jgi:hypothetical protein
MNECCQHLFREAKRELEIRDKRIKELQDECTRLFYPTREFWNQERVKPLIDALERISEICYYHDYGAHREVATKALEEYRGEV